MAGDIENTPAFKAGAVILAVAVVAFVAFTMVNLGQRETTARSRSAPSAAAPTATSSTSNQLSTVFMGDSITENSQAGGLNSASQSQPWPIRVASSAGTPWIQQANDAVAGMSTGQMLNVALPGVLAAKPQAVVIMGGTVDAGRHTKVSKVEGHLRKIVTQLQSADIKVWVVSPPPNNNFNTAVANVVSAEKKVADDLDAPFVDIFHAVGGSDGTWSEDDAVDGTLPNDAGQAAIAEAILAAVSTSSSSAAASPSTS